jgi:hypothetical protein
MILHSTCPFGKEPSFKRFLAAEFKKGAEYLTFCLNIALLQTILSILMFGLGRTLPTQLPVTAYQCFKTAKRNSYFLLYL